MSGDPLVYSTDPDFCSSCGRTPCGCREKSARRQPEPLRLSFQRGGKGKGVTRVERLNMHPRLKEKLLSRLKKSLGCGGTIKNGVLELQGDRRDFLESEFIAEGYKVKRIGG
ncbi:MAG: translation initiation factor [Elusimicrobiota bacterium]